MSKILLIDGNLLLFRSFYASYSFNKNANNLPTHLFFTSIFEVIRQEKPSYIFVAFDAHAKTKRHEIYNEYKSGRISPPPEIYNQKKIITKLLEQAKIKWFEKPGDEADDLIATLCTKYCDKNRIIIFSEDKDLYQLIDTNIEILIKDKQKKNTYKKLDNNNFFNELNFYPNQVVDFKAIAGDSSDNLKGIKGIGNKTAIELLNKYKTLDGIYENMEKLTNSQKEKFIESKTTAYLCKQLATLNRFVILDFDLEQLKFDFSNLKSDNFISELKLQNLNNLIQQIQKFDNEN